MQILYDLLIIFHIKINITRWFLINWKESCVIQLLINSWSYWLAMIIIMVIKCRRSISFSWWSLHISLEFIFVFSCFCEYLLFSILELPKWRLSLTIIQLRFRRLQPILQLLLLLLILYLQLFHLVDLELCKRRLLQRWRRWSHCSWWVIYNLLLITFLIFFEYIYILFISKDDLLQHFINV